VVCLKSHYLKLQVFNLVIFEHGGPLLELVQLLLSTLDLVLQLLLLRLQLPFQIFVVKIQLFNFLL